MDTPLPGRILIVDDLELNRDLLRSRLARKGYSISTANDGAEALEQLRSSDFDLVLLDIMMPTMNGYQVLEHMHADAQMCDIPVIVVSASDDIDGIVRCISLGAQDYLLKPFNPVLLHARIQASLEKKRLRDAQQQSLRQLEEEKQQVDDLLQVVIPIGAALVVERNLARLLEMILSGAKLLCDADMGLLFLRTTSNMLETIIVQVDTLDYAYGAEDAKPSPFGAVHLNSDQMETFAAFVTSGGKSVRVDRVEETPFLPSLAAFDARLNYRSQTLIGIPIKSSGEQVIGVLQLVNARGKDGGVIPFSAHLQQLLEGLAKLGAAALESYLHETDTRRARIHIDQAARTAQVEAIEQTDYFQKLRARVNALRAETDNPSAALMTVETASV